MEFAKVNFGLNQAYYVETAAFEAVVKDSLKTFKEYKVENIKVVMDKAQANVRISVMLSTAKTSVKYGVDIPAIERKINEHVSNLIDGKPLNIKIQIQRGTK